MPFLHVTLILIDKVSETLSRADLQGFRSGFSLFLNIKLNYYYSYEYSEDLKFFGCKVELASINGR
jgi:hypothetical protein